MKFDKYTTKKRLAEKELTSKQMRENNYEEYRE